MEDLRREVNVSPAVRLTRLEIASLTVCAVVGVLTLSYGAAAVTLWAMRALGLAR